MMFELILKAGWLIWLMLLGSVVALALVLERVWFFWRIRLDTKVFSEGILSLAQKGRLSEAAEICRQTRHPLAKVFLAGLERGEDEIAEIERVMEREGNRQAREAEKNLNYLVVVVGVEPLLGFLGTILGLIQAFMSWEKFSTSVTVSVLAGGIYQAMITTATGLIIAIPYFVIYNIFLTRVNTITQDLNHYGDELAAVLARHKRSKKEVFA
jgi:biopolymer transport protein ExbB